MSAIDWAEFWPRYHHERFLYWTAASEKAESFDQRVLARYCRTVAGTYLKAWGRAMGGSIGDVRIPRRTRHLEVAS